MSDATLARMEHGKYVGVRGEPRRDGVCVIRKPTLYTSLYTVRRFCVARSYFLSLLGGRAGALCAVACTGHMRRGSVAASRRGSVVQLAESSEPELPAMKALASEFASRSRPGHFAPNLPRRALSTPKLVALTERDQIHHTLLELSVSQQGAQAWRQHVVISDEIKALLQR